MPSAHPLPSRSSRENRPTSYREDPKLKVVIAERTDTFYLNRRTLGGQGDTPRTVMVCEALVNDRDDMVVKGMSWALRDLLKRDRVAVEKFLEEHESELAARVKREVWNKLTTGVKNPWRKKT